jgi:UDP:flavonoid glycosyltransferase YjiC (YdhE family)
MHAIPLAAIGTHLTANGHEVGYALRNPESSKLAGISPDAAVYTAPVMGAQPGSAAAFDCAHMLLVRGYGDPGRLDQVLRDWFAIFDRFSPDVLFTDHAPSARLAAHIAGIPTHAIGNGFSIPPLTTPLQSFNPLSNAPITKQEDNEDRLNSVINEALVRHDRTEIDRAVDLFFGGSTFLITFEELDNYGYRQNAEYYGPPYGVVTGTEPPWPTDGIKRVFVYLYPDTPGLVAILKSLDQLGVSAVVYTGSANAAHLSHLKTKNIVFSKRPLALTKPHTQCDLVICQGGGNTMATALLQGIPLLTYPRHVEALMACTRLKSQGLAEIFVNGSNQQTMTQMIAQCLDNDNLHSKATEFAAKYQDFSGQHVAGSIAEQIVSGTAP